MKKHLLLIGFSCTGKTSLAKRAFKEVEIVDSDDQICRQVGKQTHGQYNHIFDIFVALGRGTALGLIEKVEESLIAEWAGDTTYRIMSLGLGFPLRKNWLSLRKVGFVIHCHRSAAGIYSSFVKRRKQVFDQCLKAKEYDSWDVGVIVNEHRQEYDRETAIANIERMLRYRERFTVTAMRDCVLTTQKPPQSGSKR